MDAVGIIIVAIVVYLLGLLSGQTIFGDAMAERGIYIIGSRNKLSGWLHGDHLFLPVSGEIETGYEEEIAEALKRQPAQTWLHRLYQC